jgi:hypothetical protein
MSLSVASVQGQTVPGAEVRTVNKVTFDSSYASGGETLTPAQLGLSSVSFIHADIIAGSESSTLRPTNAYYSEGKLHLIDSATGNEVESTKDMSKVVVQVTAYGSRA